MNYEKGGKFSGRRFSYYNGSYSELRDEKLAIVDEQIHSSVIEINVQGGIGLQIFQMYQRFLHISRCKY